MKNIIYILTSAVAVTLFSCVDDYTDANPAPRLDAPFLRFSTPASGGNHVVVTTPINAFQSESGIVMTYDDPLVVTVSVVDAPGKIGNVTVTSSIPEYGTVTVDETSVAGIQGAQSGDFTFTFTPNPDLVGQIDRSFNIDVSVSDTQVNKNGSPSPKTTTLTIPVTLGKCLSDDMAPGYYIVTEVEAFEDGGTEITLDMIEEILGERAVVEFTMERPGRYAMSDATGGVWPTYYSGRAPAEIKIDLCGRTISGGEGETTIGPPDRTFTIDGEVHEDGTVTIEWSYVRDDGATPDDPAHGTFTLAPLSAF